MTAPWNHAIVKLQQPPVSLATADACMRGRAMEGLVLEGTDPGQQWELLLLIGHASLWRLTADRATYVLLAEKARPEAVNVITFSPPATSEARRRQMYFALQTLNELRYQEDS